MKVEIKENCNEISNYIIGIGQLINVYSISNKACILI